MEDTLQQYMDYIKHERRLSENSLDSYRRDLSFLCLFLQDMDIKQWQDVQNYHLSKYVHFLKEQGRKPATIARRIVTLRAFFQYLTSQSILIRNPAAELEAPKADRNSPLIMTMQSTKALLEQPNVLTVAGKRDKAMLELLYASGIRVSELINLNVEHVHMQVGYIDCIGSTYERIIPIGKEARQALEVYLKEARDEMITKRSHQSALFLNHLGTRLSRQGFWKILKRYAAEAGITEEITPQTLRHSVAAHMLSNGADIRSVQEMLGHVEIASTLKYIQSASPRLMDAYQKTHPRA